MDDFFRSLNKSFKQVKRSFDKRIGKTENPHITPYRSYGNAEKLIVMGRTLRDPGLKEAQKTDSLLNNLINSYKRIETDEIAGAKVRAQFGAVELELTADEEGFFRATMPLSTPPAPDAGHWHNVKLEMIEPLVEPGPQPTANAQVVIPPADAQFGIISDLDDTVIQTGATNIWRMVRTTLVGNAHTRLPFTGVASFYAALQQGATGTGFHPIFYVSSSPWNLYDVIEQFLALQRIPMGPTLLRDWGMSIDRIPFGHAQHKLTSIRHILDMYSTMPFILIGDSGQEDPEIYREIAREYPGRILAAYIRDVTPNTARARVLGAMVRDLEKSGIQMVLTEDTLAAARHATRAGWINETALKELEKELLA